MNYDVQPDIVSTAKGLAGGLPLGATMLGEKVKDVYTPGSHGSTFGGNPVCSAAAISVLKRIDDKLLEDVRKKSEYIFSELEGTEGVFCIAPSSEGIMKYVAAVVLLLILILLFIRKKRKGAKIVLEGEEAKMPKTKKRLKRKNKDE